MSLFFFLIFFHNRVLAIFMQNKSAVLLAGNPAGQPGFPQTLSTGDTQQNTSVASVSFLNRG